MRRASSSSRGRTPVARAREAHQGTARAARRTTRTNPHYERFTLEPAAHVDILKHISPVDVSAADRNDPHKLTAFKYVDPDDDCQYVVEGFNSEQIVGGKKRRCFTIRNLTEPASSDDLPTMWEDSCSTSSCARRRRRWD